MEESRNGKGQPQCETEGTRTRWKPMGTSPIRAFGSRQAAGATARSLNSTTMPLIRL